MSLDRAPHYPVMLDLQGRQCVVIGGGKAAGKKARALGKHGADVVVFAAEVDDEIVAAQAEGLLTIELRDYVRGDLRDAFIVVCASGSRETDEAARLEARSAKALVYVVGAPDLCDFILPSVVRREPLQIAISTEGAAPQVARRLRKRLKGEFGEEWGPYVRLLAEVGYIAGSKVEDPERRAAVMEAAASEELLEKVRSGSAPTARDVFYDALEATELKGEGGEDG